MIHDNSEEEGRRYCQIRLNAVADNVALPLFDYQPLPPRHIRVIELQPGKRSDPFRARFILGSLDESFHYDALSYMWGDAAPVDHVIVDCAAIRIAWNLATALEYLRDHMRPEPLRIWIDAICINQQDDVERANQVGMMRLLYRKANCVRIWINAPDLDEHSKALDALQKFQVRDDDPNLGLGDDLGFWNPLLPILQNEYWRRVWVQQEILNARWLILHCKNAWFIGTTLFEFRRAIKLRIFSNISHARGMMRYDSLTGPSWHPEAKEMFALHGEARTRYNLIDLLDRKMGLLLSREHDRFYAIMHLAKDYQDGDLVVDYTKSLEEVILDVATHHISRHRDLKFLLQSSQPRENGLDSCEGLAWPSWIPNCWLGADDTLIGSVCRKMIYSQCSHRSIDMSTKRLSVRGIKIDKLRKLFKFKHDLEEMTVVRFWNSPLGQHLLPYMAQNAASLPYDFYWTFSWTRGVKRAGRECLKVALAYLYELNQVAELADFIIYTEDTASLPGCNQETYAIVKEFLLHALGRCFALTDRKFLALIAHSNATEYDDIWLVLGCPVPIVVRRRQDGIYSHVCAARIPGFTDYFKGHEDFEKFTMETQPGEKIGEWIMQDIEIA